MGKGWFRLLVVFYILATPCFMWIVWHVLSDEFWGWCYDSLYLYVRNDAEFGEHFQQCLAIRNAEFKSVLSITLITSLVAHYVVQLIFFKLIVDFISLGRMQKPQTP